MADVLNRQEIEHELEFSITRNDRQHNIALNNL